jgi:sulfite reductase (NADPH) hemoprotein beta-component
MAVADDSKTLGRARLDFADEHDIDEFVEVLGKYERGEITPEVWRRFRLVRGTYGQRQDNVQMLRIKIPQGIVTASQMRTMAGVASRYSRGFCHVTTRQNIRNFVLLSVVEEVMRELQGLTRAGCGNSVRNITGCRMRERQRPDSM